MGDQSNQGRKQREGNVRDGGEREERKEGRGEMTGLNGAI